MDKQERKEVIGKIEYLLATNCRRCPERNKEHTLNPVCQACPILTLIQAEGKKFGGIDKNDNQIKKEDYALAEKNGIKKATVQSRVWHRKWPVERAVTEPVNRGRGKANGQNKTK